MNGYSIRFRGGVARQLNGKWKAIVVFGEGIAAQEHLSQDEFDTEQEAEAHYQQVRVGLLRTMKETGMKIGERT